MVMSDGQATQNLNLYQPEKPHMDLSSPWWDEFEPESDLSLPLLTLRKLQNFKDETEDDIINGFIINSFFVSSIRYLGVEYEVDDVIIEHLKTTPHTLSSPAKIKPGKCLNINPNLTTEQNRLLIQLLQKYKMAFAWDYTDIKGTHHGLCTHHIYLKEDCKLVRQPQHRINPTLNDIVKKEL